MEYKKKFYKKKKIYKRLIEIKSIRKGWVIVELLSINKGGTITIKTIDGHVIKRKWGKETRLAPARRREKECGEKPTTKLKTPLSKKGKRRQKRTLNRNKSRIQKQKEE